MNDAPGVQKTVGQQKDKFDWKTACIAGISAVAAAALSGVFTSCSVSSEIEAAKENADTAYARSAVVADTAYAREVGKEATAKYLGILLDAEKLNGQVISKIRSGIGSDDRAKLAGDIDGKIAELRAAKVLVDLVGSEDLRDMADLTIDLYGEIGGGLQGILASNNVDSLQDYDRDEGRLHCAMNAGRITFTDTAQQFLKLGEEKPDFTNNCYAKWMVDENKWHPDMKRVT